MQVRKYEEKGKKVLQDNLLDYEKKELLTKKDKKKKKANRDNFWYDEKEQLKKDDKIRMMKKRIKNFRWKKQHF